jgi:hypothetical protein
MRAVLKPWAAFVVGLAVVLVPLAAFAQVVDVLAPGSPPVAFGDWKAALWSLVVLPLLMWVGTELKRWIAAKRATAEVTRDSSTRAHVESILLGLVDAVGAPAVQRLIPDVLSAMDPKGPGGVEILPEEWKALETHVEDELRRLLTPDTLNLVMKTIGLGAAVRLVATFLIKRAFEARQSAAEPSVPTDPSAVFYGRIPEAQLLDGERGVG